VGLGASVAHAPSNDAELAQLFIEYHQTRDRRLRNHLVESYRWLAVVCARQMANRGEPLDDLIQVALIGVVKAVERFDPEYGVAFKTFGTVTVLGELRRHYRDATWRVRVPRRLQELHLEINGARDRLTHRLNRSPTVEDISEYLDVPVDLVIDAICAGSNYRTVPLVPVNDDVGDDEDDVMAEGQTLGSHDAALDHVVDRTDVARLLDHLPERERRIVELRFFHGMTQSDIAAAVGLSQVHISRLLRNALARLRRHGVQA
jgi:RNA polymerase sigma-B factor